MIASLCALAARGQTSRAPVKLADLPAAVRNTVIQQKANGNILALEKRNREGNSIYALEVSREAGSRMVVIDDAGRILEIQEPIKFEEISKAARSVTESSVGKGRIISLRRVTTAGGIIVAYDLRFERDGKKTSLRIGPDGSLRQE